VKFAVVAPPDTVTLAGTVAEDELDDSVTTIPLDGAALESVTVPTELLPPGRVAGFAATLDSVGA